MKWKALAAGTFAMAVTAATSSANPFADVSPSHWAYRAIQRVADAGVLQGYDGRFHGEKLINRYQMAVILKRLLDSVSARGGPVAAGMGGEDIKNLEAMMIEFADELALLNVKVSTLEDSFVELRADVDRLKAGGGHHGHGHHAMGGGGGGLANAFSGFVSVGLASTDDNAAAAGGAPANAGGSQTRFAGSADQTFFTIPQASIGLDTEVGDGIGLHVQYDYGTDATNGGGATVGLNEAYLFVDEIFGDIGGKVGGFALPFQSWEVNGPFRTLNDTISPSAKNNFLERPRVIGMEFTKTKDVDPADVKWHLGVFTGADTALAGGNVTVGNMSDNNLRALAASATFDDSIGYYLDVESGDDPEKDWGWRLGFFDMGGDNTAVGAGAVPAGLGNSVEIDGWQAGFWWKNDDAKIQFEYMGADSQTAAGVGGTNDITAWYFLFNWSLTEDSSITLRYDDWENEANTNPVGGVEGTAFTFAWNKRVSDTSMFQFEWVSPDEERITGASSDIDDDLIQFRYKVWF